MVGRGGAGRGGERERGGGELTVSGVDGGDFDAHLGVEKRRVELEMTLKLKLKPKRVER